MADTNPYRDLPAVDELMTPFQGRVPHGLLVATARTILDQARDEIRQGRDVDVHRSAERAVRALERSAGTTVINATGVLLHTNLGRAPWSDRAVAEASETARSYTNVEMDLGSGERSRRGSYVTRLLQTLTGAEDALVVNNNASGLLLALAATSSGRAVPVARGELIEIGGSYRLPDVMVASGAHLVEVGTTNRTRVGDYVTAIQLHDCGSILKVHPSNYRVEGFTQEADVGSLAQLASAGGIPLIYDIGSGLLDANTPWLDAPTPEWLKDEPAAAQELANGADLVTFSGDKLLGGPQAGIIVGGAHEVALLRRHPLARALRVDGVTLSALGATLEAYANNQVEELPFWRHAILDPSQIEARAKKVADALSGETMSGQSAIGAGSVPGMSIPTTLVALRDEDHLYQLLLSESPPIVARREEGALLIDLRTVDPQMDSAVVESITRCR